MSSSRAGRLGARSRAGARRCRTGEREDERVEARMAGRLDAEQVPDLPLVPGRRRDERSESGVAESTPGGSSVSTVSRAPRPATSARRAVEPSSRAEAISPAKRPPAADSVGDGLEQARRVRAAANRVRSSSRGSQLGRALGRAVRIAGREGARRGVRVRRGRSPSSRPSSYSSRPGGRRPEGGEHRLAGVPGEAEEGDRHEDDEHRREGCRRAREDHPRRSGTHSGRCRTAAWRTVPGRRGRASGRSTAERRRRRGRGRCPSCRTCG